LAIIYSNDICIWKRSENILSEDAVDENERRFFESSARRTFVISLRVSGFESFLMMSLMSETEDSKDIASAFQSVVSNAHTFLEMIMRWEYLLLSFHKEFLRKSHPFDKICLFQDTQASKKLTITIGDLCGCLCF
jgi:hypothetical protein